VSFLDAFGNINGLRAIRWSGRQQLDRTRLAEIPPCRRLVWRSLNGMGRDQQVALFSIFSELAPTAAGVS